MDPGSVSRARCAPHSWRLGKAVSDKGRGNPWLLKPCLLHVLSGCDLARPYPRLCPEEAPMGGQWSGNQTHRNGKLDPQNRIVTSTKLLPDAGVGLPVSPPPTLTSTV